MSASIVIPDLHGSAHLLEWVLSRFPQRRFIFLGDLINRGADSKKVLRTALELSAERRAILLWGNHEDRVWRSVIKKSISHQGDHLIKAYPDFIKSYRGDTKDALRDLRRFAIVAKPYITEDEALYAHAARPALGYTPSHLLDKRHMIDRPHRGLLPLPTRFYPQLTYSVHGHTIHTKAVYNEEESALYIDLGGYRTGRFCVWDAEYQEVIYK